MVPDPVDPKVRERYSGLGADAYDPEALACGSAGPDVSPERLLVRRYL